MFSFRFSRTKWVYLRMGTLMLVLFFSIYLPRYTRVSNMRQILCANDVISASGVIVGVESSVSGQWRAETSDFVLFFSQKSHPVFGERISFVGAISRVVQCEHVGKITLIVREFRSIKDTDVSPFYLIQKTAVAWINFTKNYLQKSERELSKILSPTQSEILFGMTIGRKPSPTSSIAAVMKAAGMTHVLVASGANLAIILLSLRVILRKFFSKMLVVSISLFLATGYAGIVGDQAPILRALCMYWLMSVGLLIGRKMYWQYVLSLTVGILLIYQPLLLYSLSFWLTVTATIGMFLSNPDTRASNEYITSLQSTWTVFLWTFPLLAYAIGSLTLVSIVSSFFLLWMVGPITIVGMILLLLAPVLPTLVFEILCVPLSMLLEIFIQSVTVFSQWTIFTMTMEIQSITVVFAQYIIIILYYIRSLAGDSRRR